MISRRPRPNTALVWLAAALLTGLAAMAVVVQTGGLAWIDATVETWLATHRSPRVQGDAGQLFRFVGQPSNVAIAAVVAGTLLSWQARSVMPIAVVVGAVALAVVVEQTMKAVVTRSFPAEPHYSVLEHFLHSFPSGHVAGSASLLGTIAVCLGVRHGRAVRIVLTVLVAAAVLVVACAAVYVRAHTVSDVIGGALLGGACVSVGALVLRTFQPAKRTQP